MNPARRRLHRAALELFADKGSSEVTVSELAQVAGVARGTVYNNLDSVDDLFDDIAVEIALEMHGRMRASFDGVTDPAQRIANAIRFSVRRAHDEPGWGRFVARFGISNQVVQGLWNGPPMDDVAVGVHRGRFDVDEHLRPGVLALIAGTTITAMWLVLEGHQTWREGGSAAAEAVLRALGVAPADARTVANVELPPLPTADRADPSFADAP